MELNHTDDAGELMTKLANLENERELRTQELKITGEILTQAKIKQEEAQGKHSSIKADLRSIGHKINTLKILIKAEANSV